MTFKVGSVSTRTEFAQEPGTSTSSAINWQTNDLVGIYDNLSIRTFSLQSLDGKNAEISGQADVNSTDYYGIYPRNAFASFSNGEFDFQIPTTQKAILNNYDPLANVSLAYSSSEDQYDDVSLTFNNVGAWLRVNASINQIKSVKMSGISQGSLYVTSTYTFPNVTNAKISEFTVSTEEPLTGRFTKSAADVNSSLTYPNENAVYNSASLEGSMKQGSNYYICTAPAALNGKKIKVHLSIRVLSVRQDKNSSGTTISTVTDTANIKGSFVATANKDLQRNGVYTISLSGRTIVPDFYYSSIEGKSATDIQSGTYLIAIKETDASGNDRYYCMNNTTLYNQYVGTPYYAREEITKYFDSNTNEFYIPSDSPIFTKGGNEQTYNLTFIKNSTGTYSIDSFPDGSSFSSSGNKFAIHIYFGSGSYRYIYYDSVNKCFPQTSTLPTESDQYQYFSLYSYYKLNVIM